MKDSTTIDRRTLLGATLAWATLTLSGCGDHGGSGGTGDAGGTGGGGTGGAQASSGGASGTGGTAAGTGGTVATGGTTGTGGTVATGGMTGAGGTGGAGAGGADAGGGTTCSETMTGDHVHPLTIPGSDVDRGYQDAPYILEDGGTGHTHTLELTGYDFAFLQGGTSSSADSSTTNDHFHVVSITCTVA